MSRQLSRIPSIKYTTGGWVREICGIADYRIVSALEVWVVLNELRKCRTFISWGDKTQTVGSNCSHRRTGGLERVFWPGNSSGDIRTWTHGMWLSRHCHAWSHGARLACSYFPPVWHLLHLLYLPTTSHHPSLMNRYLSQSLNIHPRFPILIPSLNLKPTESARKVLTQKLLKSRQNCARALRPYSRHSHFYLYIDVSFNRSRLYLPDVDIVFQ
jgi:hypothetical protein